MRFLTVSKKGSFFDNVKIVDRLLLLWAPTILLSIYSSFPLIGAQAGLSSTVNQFSSYETSNERVCLRVITRINVLWFGIYNVFIYSHSKLYSQKRIKISFSYLSTLCCVNGSLINRNAMDFICLGIGLECSIRKAVWWPASLRKR